MRASALALPFSLLLCGFSASAPAESATLCDYRLQYDIEIDGDSAWMRHAKNAPELAIVGDRLWIDGRELSLSATERRRLADYRVELGGLTRNAGQVALDGAQLGIDGAALAIATLSGSDDSAQAIRRRFAGVRERLAQQLDGRHLPAQMLGKDFDAELDETIDELVEEAVVGIGGGVAKRVAMALFAPSQLQARADRLDPLLEAHIERRGEQLEQRADALCAQVRRLDALENAIGRFNAFDRKGPSI